VPIQHPQTGRLAGVITLCSLDHYEWQAAFRFLFQAAQMLSLLIENEEKSRRCLLLERHQAQQMHYANNAILTVDHEGFIQAISPVFAHLTRSLPSHTIPGTPLAAVGLEIRGLTGLAHSHTPAEVEIRFRKQEREYTAAVIPVHAPKRAQPIGYVLTFPLAKSAGVQTRAATSSLRTHSDLKGHTFDTLVGKAPRFLHVVEHARRAALYDDAVLLTGESGTGKELLAHAIHQASARSQGPFVAVNCGGASEELVAAELFGYTAGAFTGAL
jgi:transcriptional regulator with PAS, ATPase and Fis domain